MEIRSALNSETAADVQEAVLWRLRVTDYWLSKLFFDLQQPDRAARYRNDPAAVVAEYPLTPELRSAVLANDVARLAPHTNPYLLRYFFAAIGMSDAEFIQRLRTPAPAPGVRANG
jgi:Aromatic-ring-opening dioxygenase LigAB, LigA subunit